MFQLDPTKIPDVIKITPRFFRDDRGYFVETWSDHKLADQGFVRCFVQDNHSYSAKRGTLRGLHYQSPPFAQGKLVRCTRGEILDVAVDVRVGSPTFGEWVSEVLTAENGCQLYIPVGFLHGFLSLTDDAEVQYKCTARYAGDCDGAVLWNSVGVDWGVSSPLLSEKDERAPSLDSWSSPFKFGT